MTEDDLKRDTTLHAATDDFHGNPVARPAELRLLGTPCFVVGDTRHALPKKAFPLIAILALSPGGSATRARLRGILWGNSEHARAGMNLRQLLSRIARAERAAGCHVIEVNGEAIRLSRGGADIDLVAYSPPALRLASTETPSLRALVRVYGGELLADFHADDDALDEWLSRERAALRAAFIAAATSLLQGGTGTPAEDLEIADRLLVVDPTQEAGHTARIRAFGLKGDLNRCRAAYLECNRVLREELGVGPSSETVAIAERLLGSAAAQLPVTRASARPNGLLSPRPDGSRPRIAVLPPVDPFDDRRLRRLGLFVLEDLTIGLARYRSFRVLAAHTAIAMASGTVARMNAEDWCDYVLASSLSSENDVFELKFRLTEAASSEVIWASSVRFDGKDLPGLFTTLSERAVSALADMIEQRELARPTAPGDGGAYRLYLEGRRLSRSTALPEIRRARRLFREAVQREPEFAAAIAGIARTWTMEWIVRAAPDPHPLADAVAHADRAIALDGRDARGFREKAYALLYMKRHDESLALFSEAAARNPNDADLLADYADALAHSGDPTAALTVLGRAMTLNPAPPTIYRWIAGSIHYQMHAYHDAIAVLENGRGDPATARLLAACYAQVGDVAAARAFVRLAREHLPDIRTERLWMVVPNRYEADTRHLIDGLRRAGLP